MRAFLAATILWLTACTLQPGLWEWQHPDAGYAERYRERDIDECEEYALDADMDGKRHPLRQARDYGGWGDFPFEFCMQQRGWQLEFTEK